MSHEFSFIEYVLNEDKSIYPKASDKGFIDNDNDFLIGDSGGFLLNIDFKFINTSLFTEVAQHYDEHGVYTKYKEGSLEYDKFWKREGLRRRAGMIAPCKLLKDGTIVDLRITGDHYNFLNYGRMVRTPNEEEKRIQKQKGYTRFKDVAGFPRFWDGHYWQFKYEEFCDNNGFNDISLKARRKGFSYIKGSVAANLVNSTPNMSVVIAAYLTDYLEEPDAICDMTKKMLDWYENQTEWKRGYLSEDLLEIELGYKMRHTGHKSYGYRSKVIGVTLKDNPSAPIGKKSQKVIYEEMGACANLKQSLDLILSNTESGAIKVGRISVFGTAGLKDANWASAEFIYRNPRAYGMCPMENVWDNDSRNDVCGFMYPQIWNIESENNLYMDEHGNTNYLEAWVFDKSIKEEKEKTLDLGSFLIFMGQRANRPSEAFNSGMENMFSSAELISHYNDVKNNKDFKAYRDGMLVMEKEGLVFKSNTQLKNEGNKIHPYLEQHPFDPRGDIIGCIREYYPPIKINGRVPNELYYIAYDPLGVDKDSTEVTSKNSLGSIYVMMYPTNEMIGTTGDIVVAAYSGRINPMEELDKICLYLSKYYNCKILAEVNRGTIVENFKRWNELHRLYKSPVYFLSEGKDKKNEGYGIVIGDSGLAKDGLLYFKDYLYTKVGKDMNNNFKYRLHYIKDLPLLQELIKYKKGGNFDRISAMRVAMFQRALFRTKKKVVKIQDESKDFFDSINLYGSSNTAW